MRNLMISGLGGSMFPFLNDNLKNKYNLFYVDCNVDLKYVYPDYKFFHVSKVNDKKFLYEIDKIITQNNIDIYIPLIDEEIKPIIENFSKKVIVISPNLKFVNLCLNKYKLMIRLNELTISSIPSYIAKDYNYKLRYPIILKPIFGRGSRGVLQINNRKEYEAYFDLFNYTKDEILVQEKIVGQEYTVGVLSNNFDDLIVINSKKVIIKKGITQRAVTNDNKFITNVAKSIISKLNPSGPFNIQLFITKNNEVKVFEINPRFSTTSIISFYSQIDEISLFLEYNNKKYNSNALKPKDGLNLYRRWENIFFKN